LGHGLHSSHHQAPINRIYVASRSLSIPKGSSLQDTFFDDFHIAHQPAQRHHPSGHACVDAKERGLNQFGDITEPLDSVEAGESGNGLFSAMEEISMDRPATVRHPSFNQKSARFW
jgi:hypothetical protein